eukprot:jgi/Mesen1/10609/ME000086S10140
MAHVLGQQLCRVQGLAATFACFAQQHNAKASTEAQSLSIRSPFSSSSRFTLHSGDAKAIFSRAGTRRAVSVRATTAAPPPPQEKKVKKINGREVVEPAPRPQATSEIDDRVVQVKNKEEFEKALKDAKNKLVVVEYAASHSANSAKIYPAMVEISRSAKEVVCLLVMGDESDESAELCTMAGVEKVPHFAFYKNGKKIHDEEGIDGDQLISDVMYYGDTDAPVTQIHARTDIETLLQFLAVGSAEGLLTDAQWSACSTYVVEDESAKDNKLVVVDVSLRHCGPCVKVYPTVVKLSKKMTDTTAFARILGDENEECHEFLDKMGVVEVPTFLFIKDGKLQGKYVGSGRGELIGEILRYQGVQCT